MVKRRAPRSAFLNVIAVCAPLLFQGCAGARHATNSSHDPIEPVNRVTYQFNEQVDQYVLSPVARAYVKITPELVRTGISNFVNNITYANVLLNDILQAKFAQGVSDFWRIFFNTLFGFGGLYDVATPMGLARHDEDFGQTLGWWGVGEGFYLVLPIFGPSSLRDAPGLATATLTNPSYYQEDLVRYPITGLGVVDARSRIDKALTIRDAAALDPYVFTRDAYRQRRVYQIWDGNPPKATEEEE